MTARERRIVEVLVEGVVDPRPPMPAVRDTDAVAAFAAALASGPALNRVGLRLGLRVLDRAAPRTVGERGALHRLPRERRLAALDRAARHPVLGALLEPLRGMAHLSYYGDLHVLRQFGYDPEAVRERATHVAEVAP